MKVIQSTETFQRSRKLSNWDQTGQKWQSEHSTSKVTPMLTEPVKTPSVKTVEPPKTESKDLRGRETEAIGFKRQVQHDTFNGTGSIAKSPKPFEKTKTVATAAFGFACLITASLMKNKRF